MISIISKYTQCLLFYILISIKSNVKLFKSINKRNWSSNFQNFLKKQSFIFKKFYITYKIYNISIFLPRFMLRIYHFPGADTQLRIVLHATGFMSLPWLCTVCRVVCRHSCRKRGSDQDPACRTLARNSGTRRCCAPSRSKARDGHRCWTTAISETGKIEQTLLPWLSVDFASRTLRSTRVCTAKSD